MKGPAPPPRTKTGNGNDGTLYGTPDWADGKQGKTLDFDDDYDDYVGIADDDAISVGTDDYTICAWIYPHTVTGLQGIACKVDGFVDKEYGFCITGTRLDLEVEKDGNNGGARTDSGVISQNQWQHVTVVFDSSTLTPVFYHDGTVKSVSVNTINVLPDQLSDDLNIGQFGGTMAGSYNFDGVIDEVRIYNRKLSAAEIAALYHYGEDEFRYDDLGNQVGDILSIMVLKKITFL